MMEQEVVWGFKLPNSNLTFFGFGLKPMDALTEARSSGRSFTRTPGVVALRSMDVDFFLKRRQEEFAKMGHDIISHELWKMMFREASAGKQLTPEEAEERERKASERATKLPNKSDLSTYIKTAVVDEFDQDAQVEAIQGYKQD